MKQILQDMASGMTTITQTPTPFATHGNLLIQTTHTLVSSGTERMLVDFGKSSYLNKALQQPEKVKMVLEKVQSEGLFSTVQAVRSKLSQPLPMGYCNVGVVTEVGKGVEGFRRGDRVASNGPHADIVKVAKNLCARIPDTVDDESAVFTVPGSIALQGIRLAQPSLGESFVVTGVGLIGLLTVQLLRAQGCRVLAIDFDDDKLTLAKQFGAETCNLGKGGDAVSAGMAFSRGRGVDGVIITAATRSNDPITHAARMSRRRGRIILVGVAGLEFNRSDFYEKELFFQVSCSYGPGRYDPNYEERGHDYPFGFVRWTEQRNFEAVLDMLADGRLSVAPLISHRFPFDQALDAYQVLTDNRGALGILLLYPSGEKTGLGKLLSRTVLLKESPASKPDPSTPSLGFIGAGNYGSRVLIPAFQSTGAVLKTVSSNGGLNALHAGKKFGFAEVTSDTGALLADPTINTVVIATRHNNHARLVCEALKAGKHVFVEKPLCLTLEELKRIEDLYSELSAQGSNSPLLMVGFNRRFSPQVQKIKELLAGAPGPKSLIMTVNAGAIPTDHWTQDADVGGGRIVGEACHFIDLLRFLGAAPFTSWDISSMASDSGDTVTIQLAFVDGSIGTVHYFANGSKNFPKERLEIFADGRILQLDNFRALRGFGWRGFKKMSLWRQDKGQTACTSAFVESIRKGLPAPISFKEIIEVSRVSIDLSLKER